MKKNLTFPIILIAVGSVLLLKQFGLIGWLKDFQLQQYFWPSVLIVIGLIMLIKRTGTKNPRPENLIPTEPGEECNVFMSGRHMTFAKGQRFEGVRVKCFMGGVKIDIREADIKDGAVIYVDAMMGGVELYLPSDVNVDIRSSCMAGGVDSERHPNHPSPQAVLILEAHCTMGGIEIK